jgi:hypothetical protein
VVSSAGRWGALIDSFREDSERLGLGLRVVATDFFPSLSAACRLAHASCRFRTDEYSDVDKVKREMTELWD